MAWTSLPLRALTLVVLVVYFLYQLTRSHLDVARRALSARPATPSGILAFPLRLRADGAITTLAHMITLTPGTIVLAMSEERDRIFVHCIDARDPDGVEAVKDRLEALIATVWGEGSAA